MQGMLPKPPRLPSLCLICHGWPSQPLCARCIERFAQPKRRCPTCALSLGAQKHCGYCVDYPSPLDACVAAVSYTFPWSDCVAQFKFQADPGLAHALADLMRHGPMGRARTRSRHMGLTHAHLAHASARTWL
jgi:predicted amidophosphoribosyltransferase